MALILYKDSEDIIPGLETGNIEWNIFFLICDYIAGS